MIGPVGQGHFLPVSAGGTGLGRIGRIHSPELSTGTLSLVREKEEELRPRHITDASIQTAMRVHVVDGDVFNEDPSVLVDDLPGFLVSKIGSSERYPLMDLRHDLFCPGSFRGAFLLKLPFSLRLGDPLGRTFQEFRILDDRPVRERSEGFHAHIDPDRKRIGRKNLFRNVLAGKHDPPFAGGGAEDRACFDLSLDRAMENNRHDSDLGEAQPVSRQITSAVPLRKGDRGVLALPLETGISGFLSILDSSEKGLKRQIDTNGDILERLGIDRFERRSGFFQGGKGSDLVIQGHSCSIELPSLSSMLQKMIVEPPTLFQLSIQKCFLFSGRIQPILKCASHVV